MKLSGLLVLLASAEASAKAVFAHFMVGNVATWSTKQWQSDIALAQSAHIDAFALNIAAGEPHTSESLDLAFSAASSLGFKLFFSFDYAGNGPFDQSDVISYINKYAASPAYYRHNGKPFASTFEGPLNAADWVAIKSATGCFFVPDWSSEGAKAALALVPGVPDGLFSWAAWPWGDRDSNTYTDASYLQYLSDTGTALPYMMPISPWFYTNLPGYNKNWLWRGDDLWYDRWEEAIWEQPDFIEIISWNDYGESHYIGPLHDDGFDAFSVGKGPFNFAEAMPHDGWRQILPFVIDTYKNGIATVTEESITAWYRLTPKAACGDGDTTGNTASQLQIEFTPSAIVQDKIFYSALLSSSKPVTVTVGGADLGAKWTHTPSDPVGIYHGSVDFGSHTGTVVVKVGDLVFTGESITTSCARASGQNGLTNWNAWVGSQTGGAVHATPALNSSEQVCVEGTGAAGFSELCEFTCQYSYCPIGACYCTKMGPQKDLPTEKNNPLFGTVGYPAAGKSADYSGLCEYACNYGYCPEQYCSTTSSPLFIPTSSPFDPPACISGTGSGDLAGLCSYACNFGYCPIHSCQCTAQGALHEPPAQTKSGGSAAEGKDKRLYDGLCNFACSRGYCPPGSCEQSQSGPETAYIGRDVYVSHNAQCEAPCVMVLPPSALGSPTTISIGPYTTSLEVAVPTTSGGSTIYAVSVTTVTLSPPPITTTEIPFSNVEVTTDAHNGLSFQPTPSVVFPPIGYPITISTGGTTTVTTRSVTLPPWPFVQVGPGDPVQTATDVQNPYPTDEPPASTSTSGAGVLPVWKTWPPGIVTPVTDKVKDIGPVKDASGTGIIFPCNVWFMNLCTDKIGGWKVNFPKGVIGPGPPPRGYFDMAGWDFPKPLPPWPEITIGTNGQPTFSEEPSCETVSASICSTTTSYGLSASGGVTKTTTTSVMSTCETIRGCSVTGYETATATAACSTKIAKRQGAPHMNDAVATNVAHPEATVAPRQDDTCDDPKADSIVYMRSEQWSDAHVAPVLALLKERGATYNQFNTDAIDGGFTPFLHVSGCPQSLREELKQMPQVAEAYDYVNYQRNSLPLLPFWTQPNGGVKDSMASSKRFTNNVTDEKKLWSRGMSESFVWQTSQISTPPGADWVGDTTYTSEWDGKEPRTRYYFEDNPGAGQYIYILEEGVDQKIARVDSNYEEIRMPDYGPTSKRDKIHGTQVAASATGDDFSLASSATVILVETGDSESATGDNKFDVTNHCLEKFLAALILVLDDVKKKSRQGKSVVNLSLTVEAVLVPPHYVNTMIFIFHQLQALDVVIVTTAGNHRHRGLYCDDGLPQRLLRKDLGISPEINNMIVVGSTDQNAKHAYFSELFYDHALSQKIVHAPGLDVLVPSLDGGFDFVDGTSISAPLVAGLIAYVRGMDSPWAAAFKDSTDVTELLVERVLQRRLTINSSKVKYNNAENPGPMVEGSQYTFIWNGQVQGESCLKNGLLTDADGNFLCHEDLRDCSVLDGKRKRKSCTLPGSGNSGGSGSSGGDGGLRPSPITWQPGTPSPTCSSNCGSLCSGYYCKPNPTGNPPDYSDPKLHPDATSTSATSSAVPTSTSKPPTPSNPVRAPSRDARWNLFNMPVTLDSGSIEHVWVGYEDDQSHSVAEYLEEHSKCYNPDWMADSDTYPTYPESIKVQNFFEASDCKFVFQVGSQSEWLGLDSGEWLGNVICSEYDYAECFKDTDKTFYACDDLDAYRTRWAYCTWDNWFTKSNARAATLSRLAAIRMLRADNGTPRLGLETDRSLSMNMTSAMANGTASHKFI